MSTLGQPAASDGSRMRNVSRIIIVGSVAFTFISYWRTAAVVLCDLASTAYYIGGIVEQSIGPAAPWFILAVMLFSYAVRSVYIESCSLFIRGGVYRVVKEAMGGTLAKLSVSALMFDYVLTGPISGVSAGQYIVGLVNDFKGYLLRHKRPIYENPSPGNTAGGLTTLEEKSLGAVQKGGRAPVTQVLRYGEVAAAGGGGTRNGAGLSLLESPGNDGVSSTALVASGATLLLFTTGRGTPLGFPVPTLKISSNTAIAEKKPHWIDLNAGALLDGTATMDQLENDLFALVLDVASGRELANNEKHGYREIAIWKEGVTL